MVGDYFLFDAVGPFWEFSNSLSSLKSLAVGGSRVAGRDSNPVTHLPDLAPGVTTPIQ